MTSFCEHGNKSSDFTTDGEFLEQMSEYQSLEEDSAPCS
jgi:hypothetical protein